MTAFDAADGNAETIVKTIVALGRSLHMQVTVEGVETDEQAQFVRGISADQVQGYYFGRPTERDRDVARMRLRRLPGQSGRIRAAQTRTVSRSLTNETPLAYLLSLSDIIIYGCARRGPERLLDLDGFLAEVGGGYWVKIDARQLPADAERPHGVAYTLTLHEFGGRRVFGIDNAHVVRMTRGRPGGHPRCEITFIAAKLFDRMSIAMRTHSSTISGMRSRQS